jgi:hypothetical protein
MLITLPSKITQNAENISDVTIELYTPLFPPVEFKGKVMRQLQRVKFKIPVECYNGDKQYDLQDGAYNNYKSLKFTITRKDNSVDVIDFELKEDLFKSEIPVAANDIQQTQIEPPKENIKEVLPLEQKTIEETVPVIEAPTVKKEADPAINEAAIPVIVQQVASEPLPVVQSIDFVDELTEEEQRLTKRLELLRSPSVLAKRKSFAELSKQLEQLRLELKPVFDGKMQ